MICPTRPLPARAAAGIPPARLCALALCLLTVPPAPAAEKVQPAPTLRQAQARFAARNVERRPLEPEATRSIRPQVVPLDDEGVCKVTPADPKWVEPTTVRPPADGSPIGLKVDFT